jgi:hypothetical protein
MFLMNFDSRKASTVFAASSLAPGPSSTSLTGNTGVGDAPKLCDLITPTAFSLQVFTESIQRSGFFL